MCDWLICSKFRYSNLKVSKSTKPGEKVEIDVENTSGIDGEEVVQVYITNKTKDIKVVLPITSLKSFAKVNERLEKLKKLVSI